MEWLYVMTWVIQEKEVKTTINFFVFEIVPSSELNSTILRQNVTWHIIVSHSADFMNLIAIALHYYYQIFFVCFCALFLALYNWLYWHLSLTVVFSDPPLYFNGIIAFYFLTNSLTYYWHCTQPLLTIIMEQWPSG